MKSRIFSVVATGGKRVVSFRFEVDAKKFRDSGAGEGHIYRGPDHRKGGTLPPAWRNKA
jgi:hypothetical protein